MRDELGAGARGAGLCSAPEPGGRPRSCGPFLSSRLNVLSVKGLCIGVHGKAAELGWEKRLEPHPWRAHVWVIAANFARGAWESGQA